MVHYFVFKWTRLDHPYKLLYEDNDHHRPNNLHTCLHLGANPCPNWGVGMEGRHLRWGSLRCESSADYDGSKQLTSPLCCKFQWAVYHWGKTSDINPSSNSNPADCNSSCPAAEMELSAFLLATVQEGGGLCKRGITTTPTSLTAVTCVWG